MSEVALVKLMLFGGMKADCAPEVSSGFGFEEQQVLLLSTKP